LDVVRHAQGIELQLAIPDQAARRLETRGRQLVGQTGCGLCGVETVAEALRPPRRLPTGRAPVTRHAVWRAEAVLPELQQWNRETGALHAAAWVTDTGAPEIVREDVGRHNALDKVIGALARAGGGRRADEGFLLVTSRASYEMVQKATVAGARLLAAVSRPTGLAVRLAEASGLTLVALLRGKTANVYAHPEGITGPD
jgi:formate dehydrogenase accessory protein FdhD